MNFIFYLYIIITIISEISAQYLFKISYKPINKSLIKYYLPLGILLYAITGIFSYKLLEFGHLGIINIIWHLFHFIGLFIVSIFVLKEKFTFKQIIASILGLISLAIFMTEGIH